MMRQFTTVAEGEADESTRSGRLSNKSHDNSYITESLDIQEIEELHGEVADQEQGKIRTKTKARKKLEREKAIQKE